MRGDVRDCRRVGTFRSRSPSHTRVGACWHPFDARGGLLGATVAKRVECTHGDYDGRLERSTAMDGTRGRRHRCPPRLRVVQRHRARLAARTRPRARERVVGNGDSDLDRTRRPRRQTLGQSARRRVRSEHRERARSLPPLAITTQPPRTPDPDRCGGSRCVSTSRLQHPPVLLGCGIGALDCS